jgi:hypothetical protein
MAILQVYMNYKFEKQELTIKNRILRYYLCLNFIFMIFMEAEGNGR